MTTKTRMTESSRQAMAKKLNSILPLPNGRIWLIGPAESNHPGFNVRQTGGDYGTSQSQIFYCRGGYELTTFMAAVEIAANFWANIQVQVDDDDTVELYRAIPALSSEGAKS